jgi:hypothetical protein
MPRSLPGETLKPLPWTQLPHDSAQLGRIAPSIHAPVSRQPTSTTPPSRGNFRPRRINSLPLHAPVYGRSQPGRATPEYPDQTGTGRASTSSTNAPPHTSTPPPQNSRPPTDRVLPTPRSRLRQVPTWVGSNRVPRSNGYREGFHQINQPLAPNPHTPAAKLPTPTGRVPPSPRSRLREVPTWVGSTGYPDQTRAGRGLHHINQPLNHSTPITPAPRSAAPRVARRRRMRRCRA